MAVRTTQPQTICRPADLPVTRGLERLVNCAFRHPYDLARGEPITWISGGAAEAARFADKPGIGMAFNTALYNSIISVPSWTNITSEASFAIVFRRAQDNAGVWELGNAAEVDHWPFSNAAYTDAFWSSRWMSGISKPGNKTWTDPQTIVLTVKDGQQRAYWDGDNFHSNTLTGGFTLPATLTIAPYGFSAAATGLVFGAALWSRCLTESEASQVGVNFWQLFEPERRRAYRVPAAAGGIVGPLVGFRHLGRGGALVGGRLVA